MAEARGRLGPIFANQTNHAIPARRALHDVRESRLGVVGLVAIASVRCERALGPVGAIEHRSLLSICVPGRSRRGSDGGDPGSLGIDFSDPINQVVPDRRAAHDVREGRLGVVGVVAIASVRCERALGPVGAIEHRPLLSICAPGRSRRGSDGGDPGSLGTDLRKPNQPRDPGSSCCARRPGKGRLGVVGVVTIAPVQCERAAARSAAWQGAPCVHRPPHYLTSPATVLGWLFKHDDNN